MNDTAKLARRLAYAGLASSNLHQSDYTKNAAEAIELELRAAGVNPSPQTHSRLPDGYVLVPIKPTKEMAHEAACYFYGSKEVTQAGGIEGISMQNRNGDPTFWMAFKKFWKAALIHAPQPSPQTRAMGADLIERIFAVQSAKFGDRQSRTAGVVDHIHKEADEAGANPDDLIEWVDIILLAIDGYRRNGGRAEKLMRLIEYKLMIVEQRTYPDPYETPDDVALEHDRS